MDPVALFKEAEAYRETGQEEQAVAIYRQLVESPEVSPLACMRLGEIFNRNHDIVQSRYYHTLAFELYPEFARALVKPDHPSYSYRYEQPNEHDIRHCPLCGEVGVEHACVNSVTNMDFIPGFHPIRTWMRCDNCHHLFANNYPVNLGELLTGSAFDFNLNQKPHLFPMYSNIMHNLRQHAPGNRLLEVGVGAGEMTAVAKEFLFDVTGLDIRPPYAAAVSNLLGIPVYTVDFQEFSVDEQFDVLCMGDVIEHLSDPVSALRKAHELLKPGGVLWISTPNFESSFSYYAKDADAMWRVVEHLNYFSYRSLRKILDEIGFNEIEYRVSGRYSGSMEVIGVKR